MTRLQADLLLVFAALIWGTAFYFQKVAMAHIGPFLFLGLRALIAATALIPFARAEARSVPAGLNTLAVKAGLVFLGAGLLQQTGMVTASVTNAGFLTSLYVILTPFMVWLLKRKAPGIWVWLGAGLAFLGLWALSGGSISGLSQGDLHIVAAAFLWAMHLVLTGDSTPHGRPAGFTARQFAVVAAGALTLAFIFEPIRPADILQALPSLLFVGLLSGALTFTILAKALAHTSESEAAILMSLDTLFAAGAGYIMLGDRLSPLGYAGAAMILAAIAVVQVGRHFGGHKALAEDVAP